MKAHALTGLTSTRRRSVSLFGPYSMGTARPEANATTAPRINVSFTAAIWPETKIGYDLIWQNGEPPCGSGESY